MIRLKEGDTWPPLEATLTDATGTAIPNLSTATVTLTLESDRGYVAIDAASVVVVNASSGEVRYDWQEGDTNVVGNYRAEFHLAFLDGTEATVPNSGYEDVVIEDRLGD